MKSKIIEAMMADSKSAHMTKASAEAAFDTVFRAVKSVVKADGSARVPDFGTFTMKHRAERTVRNPRNGEMIQTTAKNVMTFKQSKNA